MVSSWTWPAIGSTLFLRMPIILCILVPLRLNILHGTGTCRNTDSPLFSCLHSLASWRFSKKNAKMRVAKMPIQDCKQNRHYSFWPSVDFVPKFLQYLKNRIIRNFTWSYNQSVHVCHMLQIQGINFSGAGHFSYKFVFLLRTLNTILGKQAKSVSFNWYLSLKLQDERCLDSD